MSQPSPSITSPSPSWLNQQWTEVPDHIAIENCHEMAQSRDGRVFLSVDHPENNILIFTADGSFLDSWTLGYDGCHGLTLFEEGGIEYLLITQTGVVEIDGVVSKGLGEVVKTTLDGKVLRTFANPFELGIYHHGLTYNPTETCVAPNGDIYIADGYGASFIHCFAQDGNYKFSFGGTENAPAANSLINPHGIAIDHRPVAKGEQPLLVISSRKQSRFKFFTLAGEFVKSIHLPGVYPCRPVIHGSLLYCGVCWSGPVVSDLDLENYASRRDNSGFVMAIDQDGKVTQTIGAKPPVYIAGVLQPMEAEDSSPFHHVHDVLPLSSGTLLVSQWRGQQSLPYAIAL